MTPAPVVLPRRVWPAWMTLLLLSIVGAAAALLTVLLLVSAVTALAARVRVQVVIDGAATLVETRAATVADLLSEAGLSLTAFDHLSPPATSTLAEGLVIHIARARRVQVVVDGQSRLIQTAANTTSEILAAMNVPVYPGDRVLVDSVEVPASSLPVWPGAPERIELRHVRPVQVIDSGEAQFLSTTAATVGEALYEAGIPLFVSDSVEPPLYAPLPASASITIRRAVPVTIAADGSILQTRAPAGSVADALAFAGVTLMGQDYTLPAENEPITADTHIEVIRVSEMLVSETSVLPYETIYQADASRPIDTRGLAQEGREGLQRTVTRVRMENGVETGRAVAESSVAVPPQDQIITYGTQLAQQMVDTPEGPRPYWRVLRLYATSYHPAALGGDNITATGRVLQIGIVGADTDLLPFGTQVFVPGYGVGLVADTGAERHDPYWIDLGYSDADWRSWSRPIEVYLLAPPPGQIDYLAGNILQ